ncbi:MAG: hypothetical protein EOP09_05480 [Proteobacteria bacterium]|nr:MAG: hypothetical protein EOP09_05480 [Pseudomonadota bacterium]
MQTRALSFRGNRYQVTRLSSSGVGTDYTVATRNADGTEQYQTLSLDAVQSDADQKALFEACAKLFDDHVTFAKHIGSSSFWQSGSAPVPTEKPPTDNN